MDENLLSWAIPSIMTVILLKFGDNVLVVPIKFYSQKKSKIQHDHHHESIFSPNVDSMFNQPLAKQPVNTMYSMKWAVHNFTQLGTTQKHSL